LPNAESLECRIEGYGPTFPILVVYTKTEETEYFLVFQQPFYIDAPMQWTGADFYLGIKSEREEIAKQIAIEPQAVETYRDQAMLFVAKVDQHTSHPKTIQILAVYAKLEKKKT
jgi:hypothetical protein